MRLPSTAIAAAVLAAFTVLASPALAGDRFSSSTLTKQGVSGQVYVWQSGSC